MSEYRKNYSKKKKKKHINIFLRFKLEVTNIKAGKQLTQSNHVSLKVDIADHVPGPTEAGWHSGGGGGRAGCVCV